jgi:hypothetical protein
MYWGSHMYNEEKAREEHARYEKFHCREDGSCGMEYSEYLEIEVIDLRGLVSDAKIQFEFMRKELDRANEQIRLFNKLSLELAKKGDGE